MAFAQEKRQALRILEGIEQGSMTAAESFNAIEDADPTLIHFIFTWLRKRYPAQHPASEAVIGRLVAVCSAYPAVTRMAKEGESDAVVEWFEDAHSYSDFEGPDFIELIVDKLEG